MFLDVTIPDYNLDVTQLEAALSPRTRALMFAHTLGNPANMTAITEFVKKHDLYLIEDCCDAIGGTYNGQKVGTFGDVATASFYPAHHITMGEGGAVFTNNLKLKVLIESFRDWGRDCWCEPGKDNTCGKRFEWQLGDLPCGYDHKYTYSHIGYNLKVTDMQAAVGVSQLKKLPEFIAARRRNFALSARRPAGPAGVFDPAGSDARLRPVLVRLPDRRPSGRAVHPRPTGAAFGVAKRSGRACCSRAICSSSRRIKDIKLPRDRRLEELGLCDEPGLLDRRLSRA